MGDSPVFAPPSIEKRLWRFSAVQSSEHLRAGFAERPSAHNSVNLLRWGADSTPGCCVIEQWDFSAAERAFVRGRISEVRPSRERTDRIPSP
jgi:hypothetical protein